MRSLDQTKSDYIALSYAWGSPVPDCAIDLDDCPNFLVIRNLFIALRRLRHRKHVRRLWVDQICINQPDQRERKEQVKQLAQIFTQARRVILWFGDTPDLMERHEAMRYAIKNKTSDHWWTRSWILQEYALAKEEPLMAFGPYCLNCAEFDALIESKMGVPWSTFSIFALRLLARQKLRNKIKVPDLHSLSVNLAETSTQNPRDKVYFILSSLPEKEKILIDPDYEKSVSDVFAQATYASIASSGSLGILSLTPRLSTKRESDMPTWAVDLPFRRAAIIPFVLAASQI